MIAVVVRQHQILGVLLLAVVQIKEGLVPVHVHHQVVTLVVLLILQTLALMVMEELWRLFHVQ